MSAHGWRVIVAAAWLMGLVQGCRVPPVPGNAPPYTARAEESGQYDRYDGWLFNGLTGRKPADAQQATQPSLPQNAPQGSLPPPAQDPAGGVRPASATEPLPPVDGRLAQGTLVPPAGAPDPKPPKSESDGFDWSDLYPSTVYKNFKAAIGLGPDEKIAREAYKQGEELYRQKKYDEAAARFKTSAERWPDSPLEEDSLFMLGECYFFADQCSKALDTYGKLLKKHEYSRYLDKVVAREFAIGRYWEQMDNHEPHWPITANFVDRTRPLFDTWGHAIKAYENVRLNDPTGPLADDAVMATANAHFLKGRYEDAAFNYDLLRKEYPKSEHQVQAHVLGMKSKLLMYQGPLYDGKPLEEAGQIADQALTQFPDRLGPDRDRMVQAKNRSVEQLAERDWALGQYYDRRRYYGAARYYYQAVVKNHPQTQFARMAQARFEEIKDKPANPPDYFEWINNVLPSKRK